MKILGWLKKKKPEWQVQPARSMTVAEFMDADSIIPSSGGSMAEGYTGTKEEADEFVRKCRDAAR